MTKIFGRDQFFCLNFGRDQKLGEENEKGYVDQTFKFQFQWADKNYRRLLRMSGAGGKEKDKVEKVGSDFHRKILGGSDTNENISLAQFSVLVLFHSVRGFPNYVLCTDSLLFSRVFSLPGRNERWICDELLFRHLSWTDCQAGVPTQAPLSFTTG